MIIKGITELKTFAETFLADLEPQKAGATVVALLGDLGAGKTTFVQRVAQLLDIKESVTSPTFPILNTYLLTSSDSSPLIRRGKEDGGSFTKLIHVDAYRLEKGEDLLNLGFADELNNPENLIFIEWAENIADILPKNLKKIHFEWIDENVREITATW
jgi:tRNA threonylcarbamoyladenosine biosynthesis protein TsaE